MLSILINWLYMGGLVFLTGTALVQIYMRLVGKTDKDMSERKPAIAHILFSGIMGTTLYAQVFSLFYRVNWEANLVLVMLAAVYGINQRHFIRELIAGWRRDCFSPAADGSGKGKRWRLLPDLLILLAVFSFALASSGAVKLIDTDWYHAQTIRWIEEFGCVKGVANLFPALGYNNAQHYFDALFSMNWAFGQSIRGSGGFFGLVIFIHGLLRVFRWKQHTCHTADMLAVWEVAYSIIITAFFTEPYTDTLPNGLVLFILTEWLSLLEEKREDTEALGFYCLLAVFAAVCKMAVVMSVLLAAYPAYLLLKQRRIGRILMYLGMGAVIALPFLITNVITTGYPVYLLSAVDFLDVRWKMDPAILRYSVDSMIAFARMPSATIEEALGSGFGWIPSWFRAESFSHQILYVTILFFLLYDLVHILRGLIKKEALDYRMLWPRLCVCAGLVYWFFTIPQVKYCWAFLIFPVAVIPMYYWERGKHTLMHYALLSAALVVLLMYGGFYSLRTLGYMKEGLVHYPVLQADYKRYDFHRVEKNGQDFYIRKENGDIACGYYVFPYLDSVEVLDSLAVGDSLGEGFYMED